MRKIISIVLALGMILALSAIAAPVAAITPGTVIVPDPVPNCAGQIGVYTINFTTNSSLTEGVHSVCIKFPAGTVVPATGSPVPWKTGDILMDGEAVYGSEVTVTGTQVCFLVPKEYLAGNHQVIFTTAACIINPAVDGLYQLEVWTSRAPDTTHVVNSVPYEIVPCMSSYAFKWYAAPSYPEIASGFVPPFKACGQNITGSVYNSSLGGSGGFLNAFNLKFYSPAPGCFAPCSTVVFTVALTASPQVPCGLPAATVTLNLTGSTGGALNLTMQTLTWEPCKDDDGIPNRIPIGGPTGYVGINASPSVLWNGLIHFNAPGDYTLCFEAYCVAGGPACTTPNCAAAGLLVQKCITFHVHQSLDAAKITLDEKWNLVSLPLVPFDTSLTAMLSSLNTFDYTTYFGSDYLVEQDNLLSIWNYDAAAKAWLVNGDGQTTLKTIEDGKAYWFRLRYQIYPPTIVDPSLAGYPPFYTCGNYSWWVFGTALPEPPASPKVYPVVSGWNMVGFTSLIGEAANVYLKNWDVPTIPDPIIYGWNHGCFAVQQWTTINFTGAMLTSGQGYWMAFPSAGSVYQVVP